jgi:DNA primase
VIARIPGEEVERIKREADLTALVRSRGIELRKHGSRDWAGRCPFHERRGGPGQLDSLPAATR